jgi:ABC-type lipoprotein release transport system permease subunit
MLYEIRPQNPFLVASACGVMVVTSLAAAYLPAARAASVDPMLALRRD